MTTAPEYFDLLDRIDRRESKLIAAVLATLSWMLVWSALFPQ